MPASRGARILGPYGARDKWRLVIIDAGSRKSLVFSSQQQAEAAKSSIGEQLRQHVILVGEALQQFADDKRRRGCKELSVQAVYDRLSGFLPMDKPLADISPADGEQNHFPAGGLALSSRDNYIYSDKYVALIGVEGLCVVETADAILVCSKERSEDVKKVVEHLQEQKKEELL